MKILINTPYLHLLGGVANHYLGLRDYWHEDVKYNTIGKRNSKQGFGKLWIIYDIIKFIFQILAFKPNVILLNPSLGKSAVYRDFLFLKIAKLFGRKTVMFFHGFNKDNIKNIGIEYLKNNLNKSDGVIVLAKEFEEIIRSWGVVIPIHLTSTKVDDKLLKSFDINQRNSEVSSILFLSRITKEKGIYTVLDAYEVLLQKYPYLTLKVVGDGDELPNVRKYAENKALKGVRFTGALTGMDLIKKFKDGDLYFFPTFHAEGMPTSVLEAMAFGLPVITRPVGGLVDFFTNDMGRMIDSFEAKDFIPAIEDYLQNPDLCKSTSLFNHQYAKENFLASEVASKLEVKLKEIYYYD